MDTALIDKIVSLWRKEILVEEFKTDGTSNTLDVLNLISSKLGTWIWLHAKEEVTLTNNTKDFKKFITPEGVKLSFKRPVSLVCKKTKYSFYVNGQRIWERDLTLPYYD